jgi:type IV secretory pathway VirD2 relaxase
MPTYDVKITARVTKTIRVEADTEEEATEQAHQEFTVAPEDGIDEKYDQETESIKIAE